jgi:two-component system, NarL family, nitrate/nitrite response regulator NarL
MNTIAVTQHPKASSLAVAMSVQPGNLKTVVPALQRQNKRSIRILLVDDHPVVRKGIGSCLAKYPNLEVVGEAAGGHEAIRKARELTPDVIMMDMEMPEMDGLSVTQTLRKEMPQTKIIILSMHRNTDVVLRILQSGALGYVVKDAPIEELVKALETVFNGEAYYSPEIARIALNQFVRGPGEGPTPMQLTNREREVLIQIAEGLSNKEIAAHLSVGVRTVETHRERIMRKLDIHSIAGLTKFAIAKGLISLKE